MLEAISKISLYHQLFVGIDSRSSIYRLHIRYAGIFIHNLGKLTASHTKPRHIYLFLQQNRSTEEFGC